MSVVHLNKENFDSNVQSGVALVDFWAPWCGPCKMLGPIIEELGNEFDGRALVAKVDIDEESDLRDQFGVMSIPTIVLLKDGKEVTRLVGLQSKQVLAKMIEQA